jgi:lambda repressor-like predicted transcriptional regulator
MGGTVGRSDSPLAEALARTGPATVRALCLRTGINAEGLARLDTGDRYVAPWLKREIAEALGGPLGELFPERYLDEEDDDPHQEGTQWSDLVRSR